MKGVGVFASCIIGYADHIVPISQILGYDVLCDSTWNFELVEHYYPPMNLILDEGKDYCFDDVLKGYDIFYYVNPSRKATGAFHFFDHIYRGRARSICGLHGQSDKKQTLYWLEKYADEDIVLAYGKYMLDFFEQKGILKRLKHVVVTGNFRYEYYLKHKEFFDKKIAIHLFEKKKKRTLLYAPTWANSNQRSEWRIEYTSFFQAYPYLFDHIPKDYQILVKLHPMLVHFYPSEIEEIKEKYAGNPDIVFLNEIPLVYPILAQADAYLGDFSSVGYDFLTFDRPLFFLSDGKRDMQTDKGLYLYQAGVPIFPDEYSKIYQILDSHMEKDEKKQKRQEIYSYAFGEKKDLDVLKKEIGSCL